MMSLITSLLIYIAPAVSFFKPYNLNQLSNYDIYIIITSLIVVLIIIAFSSTTIYFFIKKIFKVKLHSIFIFFCFGYYLLFLFAPIKEFILNKSKLYSSEHILTSIFNYSSYVALFILLLVWITAYSLVLYSKTIALFFKRSLLIFATLSIVLSLLTLAGVINKSLDQKIETRKQQIEDLFQFQISETVKQEKKLNKHNVYYIILDAMLPLDFAEKLKLIDDDLKIKMALKEADLTYIDKSYSSYNFTHYSLASIMLLNYLDEVGTLRKKFENVYPSMMYQNETLVPLTELIRNIGAEFYWIGTPDMPCMEFSNQPWLCFESIEGEIFRILGRTLYLSTPVEKIIKLLYPNEIGNESLHFYTKNAAQKNISDNPKFYFIHNNLPHSPYSVNEKCEKVDHRTEHYHVEIKDNWPYELQGYKDSYNCTLKRIFEFMDYIRTNDPNAIVVMQADHGWTNILEGEIKILYRASIFNAIKAPEICFEEFGKPVLNINVIRFVMNCAYGLDFSYKPVVHYREAHPDDLFWDDHTRDERRILTKHVF